MGRDPGLGGGALPVLVRALASRRVPVAADNVYCVDGGYATVDATLAAHIGAQARQLSSARGYTAGVI